MAKLVFDFVSELDVSGQVFVGDEDPTNRTSLLWHKRVFTVATHHSQVLTLNKRELLNL